MTTQAWIALTRPGRDSRAGTPAGRSWLLLGLVLAGLFAMHGLGTHGTYSPHRTDPLSGTSMSSAAPAGVSHEGHDLGLGHEMAAVGADALEAVFAPAGDGWAGGLLLGLCFAVLAATFGLLLTLIARGGLTPLRLPVSAPVGPRTPRGRDPDPPDLARLSVRRC
jgi:hypothetical protein